MARGHLCGCIAARIELDLMRPLLGDSQRKPLQPVLHDRDIEVFVEEAKRRA